MNQDEVTRAIEEAESLIAVAAGRDSKTAAWFSKRWGLTPTTIEREAKTWAMVFGSDVATLSELRKLIGRTRPGDISEVNLERAGVTANFIVRELYDRLDELKDADMAKTGPMES